MKPTLSDVARRVSVSPSAVSAALRPNPGTVRLADATRQRILSAAEELGYQSNPLARGLRGQSTRTIGVLWWLGSPPSREFMARRIAQMLQQHGYTTYIADHFSSPKQVADTLSNFAVRGVDGVILDSVPDVASDPNVRNILSTFRAAVIVQATDDVNLGTDVIVHDRRTAIREAINHLAATGRRRPLFLIARYAREGKVQACFDQLEKCGLTADERYVVDINETQSDNVAQLGFDALAAWHTNTDNLIFDSLLATSDELAIGAIAWLRQHCRSVPDDVAVIGFNDTHMAPYLDPPLASVDRHDRELVSEINRCLFTRLDKPDAPRSISRVAMQFVWRPSAG